MDGRIYNIAGVLPENHRSIAGFSLSPDIYIPVAHDDDFVQVYARMPRGMTIPVARARLRSVYEQLDRIRPLEGRKRANQLRVTGVTDCLLGHANRLAGGLQIDFNELARLVRTRMQHAAKLNERVE